ncbi:hypothetical protein IAQ61_010621 [Plenodomus lingam]|uniref:uncharacterized protein n=1 Tax=Leptosphaeria maculans TaxID=5022 RepID=UPI00332AC896|nr:hypothetical protein IAQ61_010621 [Plenodomus lingam]
MLSKARHNAATSNTPNVTFLQSRITSINLPDAYADLIISNCVINLVPHDEKHRVFAEMHRLLKPGGRVAVSDILTWAPLPEDLQKNVALYVSCVAGASTKAEYERWLGEAGFEDVLVVHSGGDLNVYTQHGGGLGSAKEGVCGDAGDVTLDGPACCSSTSDDGGVAQDMCRYLRDVDLNSLAGSFKIFAVKK